MSNIVRRFVKDTTIYSLEPIITKGITFLLVPLYTAYLTPADYGNLQYILTFGAFFSNFIDLGLFSSFWKYRTDSSEFDVKDVVPNILITILFVSVVVFVLSFLVQFVLYSDSIIGWFIIIYFISVIIRKIFETSILLLRANFKSITYVVSSVIHAVVLLGTNTLFIVTFKMNYSGIIYSYLITSILLSGMYWYVIQKELVGKFNLQLTNKMLKYGIPIMVGNVAAMIIQMSDRFFLKQFTTDTELGYYSFGAKFSEVIQVLLINSFYLAWNPLRWEIYGMKDGKEIFAKFYRIFIVLLPVLTLILICLVFALAPLITVDKSFLKGLNILIFLSFSYVMHGIYYFNAMGMLFENKTNHIMYIIIISSLISLLFNFLLVPYFGMYGAGISSIISYLFMYITGRYYSQKFYPIQRKTLSEVFQIILIFISVISLTYLVSNIDSFYINSSIILAYSIFYLVINLVTKQISIYELKLLFNKILKKT